MKKSTVLLIFFTWVTCYAMQTDKSGKIKIMNNTAVPIDVSYSWVRYDARRNPSFDNYIKTLAPGDSFIAGNVYAVTQDPKDSFVGTVGVGEHDRWKHMLAPAQMVFEKEDHDALMHDMNQGKRGDVLLIIEIPDKTWLGVPQWSLRKIWVDELQKPPLPETGDPFDAFPRVREKKNLGWKIIDRNNRIIRDWKGFKYSMDPYILGVPEDAKVTELDRAYRDLAFLWHPDKYAKQQDKELASEIFKLLQEAFHSMKAKASQ